MLVLDVKSIYGDKTLATVSVVGDALEFQADNTEGFLTGAVGKSYSKLKSIVEGSSHLFLEPTTGASKYLLRYVTESGDSIEISTDNSICLYNGKLLSSQERVQLFNAVKDGRVKVQIKADPTKPVEVLPPLPVPIEMKKPDNAPDTAAYLRRMKKRALPVNPYFDPELESVDWEEGTEDGKDEAEFNKRLAYLVKHGVKYGR